MEKRPVPYRKTLFVCTHARSDGRPACAGPGRGGEALAKALKDAVNAAGLKGKVRVVKSGCLDLCEQGPNAFLFPSGEWFCGLAEGDIPELLKKIV